MPHEPSASADRLARAVIGAAIEVHRTLGPGFLESVYENALAVEMRERGINFLKQPLLPVRYKSETVGDWRLDFLVSDESDQVIIELKAVDVLAPIHRAQLISYLRAADLQLGLLINFNVRVLKNGIERIVVSLQIEATT